jgi:hypothetical protein
VMDRYLIACYPQWIQAGYIIRPLWWYVFLELLTISVQHHCGFLNSFVKPKAIYPAHIYTIFLHQETWCQHSESQGSLRPRLKQHWKRKRG